MIFLKQRAPQYKGRLIHIFFKTPFIKKEDKLEIRDFFKRIMPAENCLACNKCMEKLLNLLKKIHFTWIKIKFKFRELNKLKQWGIVANLKLKEKEKKLT